MGRGDGHCIEFLQWALPRLRMRWAGFRRVRGQVCKRLERRFGELKLTDFCAYRDYLTQNPGEWAHLDSLCRITISRFYRDRAVFDRLGRWLVESVAFSDGPLWAWSAGCASGEEPYTLALIWHFRVRHSHPHAELKILGTDSDPRLLERARRGCYPPSSLRELPHVWVENAFFRRGEEHCLGAPWKRAVEFRCHDVRQPTPPGTFHLILCRNLAFTYFEPALQRETLSRLAARLHPGGLLVLGSHESLPEPQESFEPLASPLPIFRRAGPTKSTIFKSTRSAKK